MDIESPKQREDFLKSVSPEEAESHHSLLREVFEREIEYRESDEEHDFFENLYWCAFLLFHVGDLEDVERMWEAKHINMDTGCGFDIQNLVGAGVKNTILYLEERNLGKIAQHLRACEKNGRFDYLPEWTRQRTDYFYGD